MQYSREILTHHPQTLGVDTRTLAACVAACTDCATACTANADACLAGEMTSGLRYCIRTSLDCAEVCYTTGRLLARQTEPDPTVLRAQLEACAWACRVCREACLKHTQGRPYCRSCVEACTHCEQQCSQLLRQLTPPAKA